MAIENQSTRIMRVRLRKLSQHHSLFSLSGRFQKTDRCARTCLRMQITVRAPAAHLPYSIYIWPYIEREKSRANNVNVCAPQHHACGVRTYGRGKCINGRQNFIKRSLVHNGSCAHLYIYDSHPVGALSIEMYSLSGVQTVLFTLP
jgi:hypothetical protein